MNVRGRVHLVRSEKLNIIAVAKVNRIDQIDYYQRVFVGNVIEYIQSDRFLTLEYRVDIDIVAYPLLTSFLKLSYNLS